MPANPSRGAIRSGYPGRGGVVRRAPGGGRQRGLFALPLSGSFVWGHPSPQPAPAAPAQPAAPLVLSLLERSSEAFVALDRQWRYVYVNASAERLLRKSRAELTGHSMWQMFP